MEQNCVKTFEMQLNRIYKINFCLKMYITEEENLKFNAPSLFLKKLEHFGNSGTHTVMQKLDIKQKVKFRIFIPYKKGSKNSIMSPIYHSVRFNNFNILSDTFSFSFSIYTISD